MLGVAESGYYAQRNRAPSERQTRHTWLTGVITEVHAGSHGRYGIRRVHAELTLGKGISVGHLQVGLLMQRAGLKGLTGRRRWKRILPDQISTDLVKRSFAHQEPNRLWVTDLTEHHTREGKVFCCVVLDTFSRRVEGWSIDSPPTAALATNALGMAIDTRLGANAEPGIVIHSDQGVQFGSWAFTARAKNTGLLPSTGSVGDCYDCQSVSTGFRKNRVGPLREVPLNPDTSFLTKLLPATSATTSGRLPPREPGGLRRTNGTATSSLDGRLQLPQIRR